MTEYFLINLFLTLMFLVLIRTVSLRPAMFLKLFVAVTSTGLDVFMVCVFLCWGAWQ